MRDTMKQSSEKNHETNSNLELQKLLSSNSKFKTVSSKLLTQISSCKRCLITLCRNALRSIFFCTDYYTPHDILRFRSKCIEHHKASIVAFGASRLTSNFHKLLHFPTMIARGGTVHELSVCFWIRTVMVFMKLASDTMLRAPSGSSESFQWLRSQRTCNLAKAEIRDIS